jgi:hypothetical protein
MQVVARLVASLAVSASVSSSLVERCLLTAVVMLGVDVKKQRGL